MSDDLERRLRDVPGRFPLPDDDLTRRVERRVLSLLPRLRAGIAGAVTLALVAATFVGIVIGRWVFPPTEPALAAPTAPAVTIDAQPKVASTGLSITITGSIVVRQRGERVRVEENPCGRGWRYLKLVETDERGNWSAAPTDSTAFGDFVFAFDAHDVPGCLARRAQRVRDVAVRPAVILRYRARGALEALVPAAASLQGARSPSSGSSRAAGASSGRWA